MYKRLNANHVRPHVGDPFKLDDAIVWMHFSPYIECNPAWEMLSYMERSSGRDEEVRRLRKDSHELK
jgi:hypothetical protein